MTDRPAITANWTLTADSAGNVEITGKYAWILAWDLIHAGFHLPSGPRSLVVEGERVRMLRNGDIERS